VAGIIIKNDRRQGSSGKSPISGNAGCPAVLEDKERKDSL